MKGTKVLPTLLRVMNEVMMVPVQDFTRLQDYYKGNLTENALLNKAGRLAAEQHLIMNNPNISPSMAVKMIKPMAREEGKLVKRLRTGTSGPITYQGTAEPEGMVDAPVENLLKQNFERCETGTRCSHFTQTVHQ